MKTRQIYQKVIHYYNLYSVLEKDRNKNKRDAVEKITKSNQSDQDEIYKNAKKIYEYAIIYKFLSKNKQNADWVLYSEKLKETLRQLDLSSEKSTISI